MTYGVKEICERFAVGEHTVLGWIKRGELKAINVSRRQGCRAKWRITQEALDAFELLRTPTAPTPKVRKARRSPDVIEFYK